MKHIYLLATALAVSASAFADAPAEQRDFDEFANGGCKDRNGDFIISGLVSSANEGTLVLADPTNSQKTTSVTLPGRGDSSREATILQLGELRAARTPVVVTMECNGEATPVAQHISYVGKDGNHGAITF
jgi:hypothetical protein